MKKNILFAVILSLFVPVIVSAQLSMQSTIQNDPSVKIGKLQNGMTYAIKKNGYPEQKATVNLFVKAGSAWEQDNEQGISHLIEHLAFNGSKNFTKNDVIKYLESIGLTFGGDLNAETGFIHTDYFFEVPTHRSGAVDSSLLILSDFAFNLTLKDEDVKNERAIVQNERELRADAQFELLIKSIELISQPAALDKRLPIGDRKVIDTVHPSTLRNFYKKWYVPENMMLVVAGDINVDAVEKTIASLFSNTSNNKTVPEKRKLVFDAFNENTVAVFEDKDLARNNIQLFFTPYETPPVTNVETYKKVLLKTLAFTALNERFSEAIREGGTPYQSMSFSGFDIINEYAHPYLSGSIGQEDPINVVNSLFKVLGPWYTHGITAEELDRYKANLLSSYETRLQNKDKIHSNNFAEEIKKWFQTGETIASLETMAEINRFVLQNITANDVNKAITEMNFSKFRVLLSGNNLKKTASTELIAAIENGFEKEYAKNETKALPTSLLNKKLTAGKILKESVVDSVYNVKRLDLSNGVSVYIQKTDHKKETVVMSGYRSGGVNTIPATQAKDAIFANAVVNVMGYGDFSPARLNEFMAGKVATVSVVLGDNLEQVTGNSRSKDMQTMFELLQLKMLYPRYDSVLFKTTIENVITANENVLNDPQSYFRDTVHKVKYGKNVYAGAAVMTPQVLKSIQLKQSYDHYKQAFSSAEGFTFYFIGDYNEDTLKNYIKEYIASLPVNNRKHEVGKLRMKPLPKDQSLKIVKGSQKGVTVSGEYYGEMTVTPKKEWTSILLTLALNQRIVEYLREEKQLIYSGGMNLSLSSVPEQRFTMVYQLPTQPQHLDSLLKEKEVLFKAFLKDGPTDKELETAKSQLLNQLNTMLKENTFWMDRMVEHFSFKKPLVKTDSLQDEINKTSKEDIMRLFKEVMDKSYHFQYILIPETK